MIDRPDHQARDDVDSELFLGVVVVSGEDVVSASDEHVGEQAAEERVEDDRLGEREAEPLDAGELPAELGLAGDRLDHGAEDVADADAGADRAEPDADSEGDRLAEVGERRVGGLLRARCPRALLSSLVFRFDGPADVDGGEQREDEGLDRDDDADLEDVDRAVADRERRSPPWHDRR